MDNKTYLDQIAVKSDVRTGSLLSPTLIKLIIGAVVLIVLLLVAAAVISNANKADYSDYQNLNARYTSLLNSGGAIVVQQENLRSSKLRDTTKKLLHTGSTFQNNFSKAATSAGIKLTADKKITEEVAAVTNGAEVTINDAFLNGYLDRAYAAEVNSQITIIMQLEQNIINSTNNESLRQLLATNRKSLETYQKSYEKYIKSED